MSPSRHCLPFLLAVCLTACSRQDAAPTAAEARVVVERDIAAFSQGCIRLLDFHKTGERPLGTVLLVDATATIEFLEDCQWPLGTTVLAFRIPPGTTPGVRKGEQRTLPLELQFHQTKQGWEPTPLDR